MSRLSTFVVLVSIVLAAALGAFIWNDVGAPVAHAGAAK